MAWKRIADSALYTWDGSDSDFPTIRAQKGMPTYGYPLLPLVENPEALAKEDPIHGVATFIVYSPLDEAVVWGNCTRANKRALVRKGWNNYIFYQTLVSDTEDKSRYWLTPKGKNPWYSTSEPINGRVYCVKYHLHNAVMRYRKSSWSVTVRKSADHAGVRLPTDPVGVREMLRDREKNSSRRSPLLHWVTEHTRRSRIDEEATHEVRAHIRGSRKCNWRGYLVEIRESELEREQLVNR